MNKPLVSIAVLKAKPGKQQALKEGLLALVEPTRTEPGNLDYVLYELRDEPGTFYMREAFKDQAALDAHLKLVHLTAEPISVADISRLGFGKPFTHTLGNAPAKYGIQTRHAGIFGASGRYQYSARETVQAIRGYAQSEPLAVTTHSDGTA